MAKEELLPSQWGMTVGRTEGNTVSLTVMSKAKAFVGKYSLFVETRNRTADADELEGRFKVDDEILVLFNPWCEGKWYCRPAESQHGKVIGAT